MPAKRIRRTQKYQWFSIVTILVLLATMLLQVPAASALTDLEQHLIDIDANQYVPDAGGCTSGTLSGTDNIAKIYNYLVGKGLKDFQASGIMGNLHHESGYNPRRVQGTLTPEGDADTPPPGDIGYGIAQWTPGTKILPYAQETLRAPSDLGFQLDFLWKQFNNEEKAAYNDLLTTTDVEQATLSFETRYERHKGPPQPDRIVEAERILDLVKAGQLTASVDSGASGCSFNGSGLSQTVVAYAWPEYHPKPYVNKKPEYESAVETAIQKGQYVGGISYPGVDCGGFVTRLMLNSGFEPGYNYGGLLTGGAGNVAGGQKPWLDANWQKIGHVTSTSQLQPGDVAIFADLSHTYAFVGSIPGFGSDTASASLDSRAPMAGRDDVTASNVIWYRKK